LPTGKIGVQKTDNKKYFLVFFNNTKMPNPKRRHSQQRSAKRRTHYKATAATLSTDSTTGELHVRHRAHVSEGKLYYKGKILAEKSPVNK
jgi:large subunit ribosomal protein L32